jgi:multiple sugar transport system permease protein
MKVAVPRTGVRAVVPRWTPMTPRERKHMIQGLLFISPWLFGFLTLTIFPLLFSLYISLTRYDLLRPPVFIGIQNYTELFFRDPLFWKVVGNTLFFVVFSVPLSLTFAFLVANLLNSNIVGRSVFRAIMYIPSIVPAVATAMVWLFLLNIQYGAVNGILQSLGLKAVPFLSNPSLAKPSLIMVAIWSTGNAVVIFLAGLQDVPRSLYEAATVDGANAWHQFRHITIPMSTPVILFNLIIGFINAFQEFTSAWLITNGGPANATNFYALYLYRQAFQFLRMGKASALAWILFVVVVVFSVVMFRSSARWVYYGGSK